MQDGKKLLPQQQLLLKTTQMKALMMALPFPLPVVHYTLDFSFLLSALAVALVTPLVVKRKRKRDF